MPLKLQKVFQIKYFAIFTYAIIEEMPAADDESPISHAQFPLGKFQNHQKREGFSQRIVEIKDIARYLSLSVRNKLTIKKLKGRHNKSTSNIQLVHNS